jgi:hypothetical protein
VVGKYVRIACKNKVTKNTITIKTKHANVKEFRNVKKQRGEVISLTKLTSF